MLELKTKISTDGIKQGLAQLKAKIKDTASGITDWGRVYSDACANGNSGLKKLAKQALETQQSIESQKNKIAELKKEWQDLNDGTITEGEKKFADELRNTNAEIAEQEEQMYAYYARLDELQANAFIAPDEEGKAYLAGADKEEFDEIQQKLDELEPSIELNKEKCEELKEAWKNYADERKRAIDTELGAATKEESNLEQLLAQMRQRLPNTFNEIGTSIKGVGVKIGKLAARAFVFNVISKALQAISKLLQGMLLSDGDFKKDFEELKAALYAIAVPIVDVIRPAIQWIVAKIRDWAVSIGKIGAAMKGMTYSEYVQQAKASKEAADNYENMADSSERMLASFDNIEILDSGSDDSSSEYSGYDSLAQYDTGEDESKLANFAKVVAGALITIGVILLFKGLIPLGIGLISAGAATEGIVEATTDNGEQMAEVNVQLTVLMAIVATAMITIGIILCFCGLVAKGIGFILAGAATEIATIAINWNYIVEKVTKLFQEYGGIIAAAGAALIILGIILCCTGVGLGIGIGLIAAGAASIVGAIVVNWDAITGFVKKIWESVKAFWNKWIAPIFTKDFWLDLAKKCANGLIEGFENGVNGILTLFENMINWIVDGLNKISFDVPDWVPLIGGKTFGFNIPNVAFTRLSIPRLAQGAVIPANREFLAVLGDQKQGTNIEAPAALIKSMVKEALAEAGSNSPATVVLEVDGREFGRVVVDAYARENKRVGTRFVTV